MPPNDTVWPMNETEMAAVTIFLEHAYGITYQENPINEIGEVKDNQGQLLMRHKKGQCRAFMVGIVWGASNPV